MKTKKTRNEIRRDRIFATACLILITAFILIVCTIADAITNNVAVNRDSVVVYQEEGRPVPVEYSEASDNIVEAELESEPEIDIYPVNLDADLQRYIIETCEEYMINPSIIIAMCFYESSFNVDAIGDNGEGMGLMGINPRWCWPEMEKLNCPDMRDPYQNVTVGIDIFAQKLAKYDGNTEMALMSYNAGDAGDLGGNGA